MFKMNKVSLAALAALGGAIMLPSAAWAQQAPAQAPAQASQLEMVTVTGSRIKRTEISSAPIATVAADEIKFSGATRVEDLLNTLPQLAPGFDSFTVNPTTGFATADLRGMGSQRTLVLVNGHRLQPGGIRSEARDLNQIPAALIKRVDILTGGASAVYGADAMAGVVNFVLDTDFEGFSATAGWSGYQHENRSTYLRSLMDARKFTYPTGSSGPDGQAYNVDLAWGSPFADGKGHAMAYATYRKNDELRQGARDYSSCALNAAGTACGGSGTSVEPNFLIFGRYLAGGNKNYTGTRLLPNGRWAEGSPAPYNYAPINHYQRPDERWTFGNSLSYEVNSHFRPFVETMFTNTNTAVQIAESGTFFANDPNFAGNCANPLFGTLCADLGLDPNGPLEVYVGKRNVEGGPRISRIESNSFRVVTGAEGDLFGDWSYKFSFLYGRNSSVEASVNDFITSRLDTALRDGSYNVWVPGGVTAASAAALSGTGIQQGATSLRAINAYLTGELPFALPTAGANVSAVFGAEHRRETYRVDPDANMAIGNFTGLGGPRAPIQGEISVAEVFTELQVPVLRNMGFIKSLDADLGYRASDYNTSGRINTYKIGGNANFGDFRARAGYNRAIRAPQTGELFAATNIGLWSGSDPCSGATPVLSREQCARTGVTAAQYGNISASPASQYNQLTGGNAKLDPEKGDTWTVGLVATPLKGLSVTLDYFDIKLEERIGAFGASNILTSCATTGNAAFCNLIKRNRNSGDLWLGSNPATSGYVENTNANVGELRNSGVDLGVSYNFPLMGGRLNTNFYGTLTLKSFLSPLAGIDDTAAYDCKGVINETCQTPEWKHTVSARYSKDWWSVNLRWRHVGEMKYVANNGTALTADKLLANNGGKLKAWDYLDLSGSVDVNENISLTFGINNVADKAPPMVGSTLSLNGTAPGGYDQLGRYLFANINFRY
jgi:iron complex outermembrane receptor protein